MSDDMPERSLEDVAPALPAARRRRARGIGGLTEERRPMASSSMDDLPLILGFTVVAFVLGAATPVIVHRLEPPPPPPRPSEDVLQLREAVGALDRTVGDLSKTVSGLAADVNRLRVEVAAARHPPEPPPPSASPPEAPAAPPPEAHPPPPPEAAPAAPGPGAGEASDQPRVE